MPEQKGKRRKTHNRTRRAEPGPAYTPPAAVTSRPTATGSRSIRGPRWNPPLWVNVIIGPLMILAGLWFGLLQPGQHTTARLFLLVAYLAVGIWYLYKASVQIRAKLKQ
jgi:hypothetical protein